MVELRSTPGDVFAAISEAMTALANRIAARERGNELLREQHRELICAIDSRRAKGIRENRSGVWRVACACAADNADRRRRQCAAQRPQQIKGRATCIPWTPPACLSERLSAGC